MKKKPAIPRIHEPNPERVPVAWRRPGRRKSFESIRKAVGRNLKTMRQKQRLSAEEVARKFSYSRQLIYRCEAGINLPNPTLMIQLADLYDVSLDWLFGRTSIVEVQRPSPPEPASSPACSSEAGSAG